MDTSAIADAFDTVVDDALIWVSDHGAFLFDWVRAVFEGFYDGVLGLLTLAPWPVSPSSSGSSAGACSASRSAS